MFTKKQFVNTCPRSANTPGTVTIKFDWRFVMALWNYFAVITRGLPLYFYNSVFPHDSNVSSLSMYIRPRIQVNTWRTRHISCTAKHVDTVTLPWMLWWFNGGITSVKVYLVHCKCLLTNSHLQVTKTWSNIMIMNMVTLHCYISKSKSRFYLWIKSFAHVLQVYM